MYASQNRCHLKINGKEFRILKRFISLVKFNILKENFAILAKFLTQNYFSCQATPKVQVLTSYLLLLNEEQKWSYDEMLID